MITDPVSHLVQVLLAPLDWRVYAGEHWAIIGPNGAGKTTLLRLANGRQRPTAGTVSVLGTPIGEPGMRDPRPRMGLIESTPPAFALGMTTTEVVTTGIAGSVAAQGARTPRGSGERALELLDLFGCARVARRRFSDCSRGERQRVMLARALMRDPALLLLDEPTTGLDLPGREDLLLAMSQLAADRPGLASVVVSHHVEELAPSTTHALLLANGRATAGGVAAEVLTGPLLSRCLGIPVEVTSEDGRWSARRTVTPTH